MRVTVVFGTRPEVIKLAPVITELKARPGDFKLSLLATAQHRGMLDQMLSVFGIKPDRDLNIMKPNQSLGSLTANLMKGLSKALQEITPDLVLVQGDTTTVMTAGLAAFYQRIPVGHIEAGLRTQNIYNPFPEEINRRIISLLGTYNFAPTTQAAKNLRSEGISSSKIFITGNTVVDALKYVERELYRSQLPVCIDQRRRIILVTAHRRENLGKPFKSICLALKEIARCHEDIEIVYPVHPNPIIRRTAYRILSGTERIRLVEPMPYLDFLGLMKKAYLILTDSGGIQEEAPSFHIPLLVLRDVTERPEGVSAGLAKLVGTDKDRIISETRRLLSDKGDYLRMARRKNPYGDGKAARRIVDIIAGH
jgi:UDP-N-acetylglucosamine 2-epimerase (non-hydrolysing)